MICDTLNVLGATYANCDGKYKVTADTVEWAPERPVYKHITKNRYIFWNAHGLGWSIGKAEYLNSGSHWHRSKSCDLKSQLFVYILFTYLGGLDTSEPWQGNWNGGVLIECLGKEPRQLVQVKDEEGQMISEGP